MTSIEEKRESYSKLKSWADHCSSDEESDDELHPARLASTKSNLEGDLSYDDGSQASISVTADDNLDDLVPGGGGQGGHHGHHHGGRGSSGRNNQNNEEIPKPPPIDFNNVPSELPKQPPYTAYIRNLCFKIQEPGDLANKVEGLTRFRYKKSGQHEVRVTNARLGIDRNTGKRKGFGYVEFDTPEELMLFLNLNDGFSRINGRDLVIDVANNSRGPKHNNNNRNNSYRRNNNTDNNTDNNSNSNLSEIDGSKFRGGRYSKSSNGGSGNQNNNAPAPPAERRSLKGLLAPRTKPVEGSGRSTSQSTIFGDARPRDEQSWRKKKEDLDSKANPAGAENGKKEGEEKNDAPADSSAVSEASAAATGTIENTKDSFDRNIGKGGRGGRGRNNGSRGSGGRGGRGGRGRNNRKNSDRNRNNNQSGKDADGWDEAKGGPSALPQRQEAETKTSPVEKKDSKTIKVANKFAALLDDSDSESD